jgi:catechol 2,3-dioxygenase-like lactoylglutathione lyase family enzyme
MAISSIFHVNLNCRNFEKSLAFYQALGFTIEIAFPEAGHPAVAQGLAVGEHRVKGALLKLGGDANAARLDLLEWTFPRNESSAPPKLSDPGIVRIALSSTDFEADFARLQSLGVEFISDPIYRPSGDGTTPMFVCFRDPDGNVLELVNRPQVVER